MGVAVGGRVGCVAGYWVWGGSGDGMGGWGMVGEGVGVEGGPVQAVAGVEEGAASGEEVGGLWGGGCWLEDRLVLAGGGDGGGRVGQGGRGP